MVVAKTLDITQAGKEATSLQNRPKVDLLHGVSAIPVRSILQNVGQEVTKKFRPPRVAKRFVQERERRGHASGLVQRGERNGDKNGRSPNALPHEQLGSFAELVEANMDFARQHALDLCNNTYNVERIFPGSRSDCNHEKREITVDSGATLHMMSITFGEWDSVRTSKEPTVIMTAHAEAESTEDTTVFVSDLDVSVAMMLLEVSPAVSSLRLLC